MPIKTFCIVFNLNIVVATIRHLDLPYNSSTKYVAVGPYIEKLFFIIQTLRLHILVM